MVFVTAVVSKIVHRQYEGDTRIGPVKAFSFSKSTVSHVTEETARFNTSSANTNYKHDVQYEFGMAFYWNLAVQGWIFIHAAIFYTFNPYRTKSELDSQSLSEVENYI